MANIAQATFVGGNIIIQCDGRWDCCQREQAAAKVRAMNAELSTPPQKYIKASVTEAMQDRKEKCQNEATREYQSGDDDDKAQMAKDSGAPDCLAKKIEDGEEPEVQMDHPLDVKLGGAPDGVTLTPLETPVNGCFGSFAKNLGNRMRDEKQNKVESISLVCPADKKCKSSNNAGPKRKYPTDDAAKARETTYNFSALG
jgi:hypothetical protein